MKYRIQTDAKEFPESALYWAEQEIDGEWCHVFGTMGATAGEAWDLLQVVEANQRALVTPEERKYLLERRKDFLSGAREVVWDESLRQAKAAFVHENHGGCLPREDDNFFATGSDLV